VFGVTEFNTITRVLNDKKKHTNYVPDYFKIENASSSTKGITIRNLYAMEN